MSKIRVGNKANALLNGEWGGHVRRFGKQHTAGKRRMQDKKIIQEELEWWNDLLYESEGWWPTDQFFTDDQDQEFSIPDGPMEGWDFINM